MDKINVYVCDDGHRTITRDSGRGVTPMQTLCRQGSCKKMAIGQLHRVNQNQVPEWEWYKPNDEDIKQQMKALYDNGEIGKKEFDKAYQNYLRHTRSGGLLLRKIKPVNEDSTTIS